MAIQNDIKRQELVQTERMEREIQLARQIQETFLPDTLPSLPKWELDMRWETAREIGGAQERSAGRSEGATLALGSPTGPAPAQWAALHAGSRSAQPILSAKTNVRSPIAAHRLRSTEECR